VFVIDSNVLIDYRESDLSILSRFSITFGQIYVPTLIKNESRISLKQLTVNNLELYEPTIQELMAAHTGDGGLSVADRLCLHICQSHHWICLTNEKLLRNECIRNDVQTLRGLRMLIMLKEENHITREYTELVARQIQQTNPCISKEVFQEFYAEIYS